MKITCISDTHRHRPKLDGGDLLIFAGDDDILDIYALMDFTDWITEQKYKHKVVVMGNHDWYAHFHSNAKDFFIGSDIIYLQDSSVTINGLRIYGTPYTPIFCNWAFMESEEQLAIRYSKIPKDTSILVTHGPKYGTLDQIDPKSKSAKKSEHLGSKALAEAVSGLVRLKYHICGHIHGSHGIKGNSINCSISDEKYEMSNKPINIEI